jgi:hypothetical protein
MADNLSKGSKHLEGKGGSLKDGKHLKVKKNSTKQTDEIEGSTPKVGTSKMNESGKGSGNR